jgi:glutamate-ammonia-ligase adenylyltransferase
LVERVSDALDQIVSLPRDRARLAADIAEMRGRIEREKAAANVFDVKLARGGLIDCEFAAQYLMLAGLGRQPGETTLETLQRGFAGGMLSTGTAEFLVEALGLQGALLQVLRIADEKTFDPSEAPDALKRLLLSFAASALSNPCHGRSADELASFEALQERLAAIQSQARRAFEAVLGVAVS